ncbi:MAG: hypothetical protein LUE27_11485 [Clostridia bacterium]|nr:hypothetical protein [Clostridia bacterium]
MTEKEEREKNRQRKLLRKILGQYYDQAMRRDQLEERLHALRASTGAKAVQYRLTPSGGEGRTIADDAISAAELEEKLNAQIKECYKTMNKVQEVLDYLPPASKQRIVLEYRHIDCLEWQRVADALHYSRGTCWRLYGEGIDLLLEEPDIQDMLRRAHRDHLYTGGSHRQRGRK